MNTNEDGTPAEVLPLCDYCEEEMPGSRYISDDRRLQYCSLECKLRDEADVLTDACAKDRERGDKAEAMLARVREWTRVHGAELIPSRADTYGEGVRDSKQRVARMLDSVSTTKEEKPT